MWIGTKTKPVFVSIGHRVSLDTAIKIVDSCSFSNYPEPLRQAHLGSIKLSQKYHWNPASDGS